MYTAIDFLHANKISENTIIVYKPKYIVPYKVYWGYKARQIPPKNVSLFYRKIVDVQQQLKTKAHTF